MMRETTQLETEETKRNIRKRRKAEKGLCHYWIGWVNKIGNNRNNPRRKLECRGERVNMTVEEIEKLKANRGVKKDYSNYGSRHGGTRLLGSL